MSFRAAYAGLVYFLIVFAAGFALGVVRTLWLAPRIGDAWAELVEIPLMLVIVFFVAFSVSRRLAVQHGAIARLTMGGVALLLLLAAEMAVVLFVDRQSIAEYIQGRDPVAGSAYLFALALFLLAPFLLRRR